MEPTKLLAAILTLLFHGMNHSLDLSYGTNNMIAFVIHGVASAAFSRDREALARELERINHSLLFADYRN